MTNSDIIYSGNARVYLEGKGALQPVDVSDPNCYTYFVGSVESAIKIKDFRPEPIHAAEAKIQNKLVGEFADVFNQPAEIEIIEEDENIEIAMRPGKQDSVSPILWMGVIYDGKMPVHKITWEALKPIRDDATAFAVLVSD
ncbi:MAG: hypothetical protein EHM33_09880 [Chloroflexi bacterium]|nr:MAG: hypothetical protein EHM33_09880 [Chloroflexota bacterium]